MTKQCEKCGMIKDADRFATSYKTADKLSTQCLKCKPRYRPLTPSGQIAPNRRLMTAKDKAIEEQTGVEWNPAKDA